MVSKVGANRVPGSPAPPTRPHIRLAPLADGRGAPVASRRLALRWPMTPDLCAAYDAEPDGCAYLAVALHEISGLPIEVSVVADERGPRIAHAYVVDGAWAHDAYGTTPLAEARTCRADGSDVRGVSVAQLAALCRPQGLDARALADARAVAAAYFRAIPVEPDRP